MLCIIFVDHFQICARIRIFSKLNLEKFVFSYVLSFLQITYLLHPFFYLFKRRKNITLFWIRWKMLHNLCFMYGFFSCFIININYANLKSATLKNRKPLLMSTVEKYFLLKCYLYIENPQFRFFFVLIYSSINIFP